MADLYPYVSDSARAMVFVDGENLAIRYGNELKAHGGASIERVSYRPSIAVWTQRLRPRSGTLPGTVIIRKYYYTSVQGDDATVQATADWLKEIGFESPRVFKKNKTKGSKQVDISLAIDILVLS